MTMTIRDLYRQEVIRTDAEDSLRDAADLMSFEEVGALAVFAGRKLDGIITEKDLVRAIADGADMSGTTVGSYMTAEPRTVQATAPVTEAIKVMSALGARHLPVVEGGMVTGMVSARDLVDALDDPARGWSEAEATAVG